MHFDMGEWRVRLVPLNTLDPSGETMEVRVFRAVKDGYEVLQPGAKVVRLEAGAAADHLEPFAILPAGSLQSLADELYENGYRPKARRYEEEAMLTREIIARMEINLRDMRALAGIKDKLKGTKPIPEKLAEFFGKKGASTR